MFFACVYVQQAVIKYLYDVRRDAVALRSEYGVRMRGVVDLQLADVAVRQAEGGLRAGSWVEGLVSALSRGLAAGGRASAPACLAEDLAMATSTSRRYHESNNTQVWSHRPLTPELCEYAATDVRYLHALAEALSPRISRELAEKVLQESSRRTVMTKISNNKDLRAAAPVMITRQRPGGLSEVSAGTWRAAERVDSAGSASGSGFGGGLSRDAPPYMGLMEWLTAALLLRYDRCGLAALAMEPPVQPSRTCSAGGGRTAEYTVSQQQTAAAAPMSPPLYRLQFAAGSFDGTSLGSGSGERAATAGSLQKPQPQPSAGPGSAAAFDPVESAATGTATERAAAPASVSSTTAPAAAIIRTGTGTDAAAAGARSSEPASAIAAAVATQPLIATPASGREAATATETGSAGAISVAMSMSFAAAVPTVQSPTLSSPPPPPPPPPPLSLSLSVSRAGEPVGRNGQLTNAHETESSPALSSFHAPLPSPPLPPESSPSAPLLVTSVETLVWAEQSLSQLWLELRAQYDDVDRDEEQRLARLAARWLLASQKGLVILAGGPGGAALSRSGISVRRDLGLRWLLG
ncbi:hypothetical protein Vafri_11828 [Volvox africanus]|uniref:3'-5' exonuclease domain-containing protein n=1 Tax=Volvox africanus TaxID=51714 RepID=A0A8J4F110_9CHLO|nr:hypothetical protein Vafri_11828 [Volvox africanus]